MKYAAAILLACALSGCQNGFTLGLGYTSPDGETITGTVRIDPSFAKQKK